jgi:hypothetical protein
MTAATLTLVPDLAPDAQWALEQTPGGRPLAELAAPGRLVELGGAAQTTAAVTLLRAVQHEGETAAWIQIVGGDLYPPDLAAAGVDIEALIVVHTPPQTSANHPAPALVGGPRSSGSGPGSGLGGGPAGQCRAAELLLRSGGFGLIILDFGRGEPRGSTAWQGRLLGLARQHAARVVILRERSHEPAPASLGPLTSLRLDSRIERDPRPEDPPGFRPRTARFVLRHELLKNKSGGPVEPAHTWLRGPWGLG